MKLSTRDLEFLKEMHDEHLQDTCTIVKYMGEDTTPRGGVIPVWIEIPDVPCGFSGNSRKYLSPNMTVVDVDGVLRLSLDTDVSARDKVRITKRYGVEVEPMEFEFDGEPIRGSAGQVVGLIRKKVTE